MMQQISETENGSSRYIQLSEMPQASKALFPDDDWTGVSNQQDRRRRQNRINQRARRQRRNVSALSTASAFGTIQMAPRRNVDREIGNESSGFPGPQRRREPWTIEVSMSTLKREIQALSNFQNENNTVESGRRNVGNNSHPSVEPVPIIQTFLDRTTIPGPDIKSKVIFPLSSDHLLTLIQYNVFRAVIANALCLGINPVTICCENSPPMNYEGLNVSIIPPHLQPTGLQKTVPHHILLDLFPLPEIRHNLLLAGNSYDSETLAADIFDIGGQSRGTERNGLIIWGEPWDSSGWEVSEGFARKWTWVLKGCPELLKSTDYWRQKRGDKRLVDVPLIRT